MAALVLKNILVVNCKNLIEFFWCQVAFKKLSCENVKMGEVKHYSSLNKKSNEMTEVVASESVFKLIKKVWKSKKGISPVMAFLIKKN